MNQRESLHGCAPRCSCRRADVLPPLGFGTNLQTATMRGDEVKHLRPAQPLRETPRPRESEPGAWNTFFAIYKPIVVSSGTDASLRMVATLHSGTAMPSGGVHPISLAPQVGGLLAIVLSPSNLRDALAKNHLQPWLVQIVGQAPDGMGKDVERLARLDARVLVDHRIQSAIEQQLLGAIRHFVP